jgi:hypothetical protein
LSLLHYLLTFRFLCPLTKHWSVMLNAEHIQSPIKYQLLHILYSVRKCAHLQIPPLLC